MHVELRVAFAVGVLREGSDDEPLGVPVLSRRGAVMAGADVSGPLLGHGDHPVIGPLHRGADLLGLLRQPLRIRFAPLGRRFGRGLQERGPQHRHRLRRAERVVVERHAVAELRPQPQPDLPGLLRRDDPAPRGDLLGHLGLDPGIQ